ncbi:hypothetical protein Plhal710r2_c007g0031481 [Plasmopara halstedii]
MLLKLVKGEHLNVSSMKAEYKQYYESMSRPEILGKSKVSNTATAGFKGKNRLEHNENLYKDFLAFRDFVHTYNEENPATTVGLLPALIARFGEKSAASVISAAKTDSNTAEEANELETKQIERWVAMKDPAAVLELIDFGDQSLRSIRTLFKVFDQFLKKNETPPFDLMATLTKYSTEKRLVQIVMKEENDADVERLKTLLFLDWFNGMKSDEDVKNLLHLKGLDTKKIDSCYDSFKEFCKNMTKVIKSTLAENVPTPAGNTIDHESNYDSLMRTAYETSLANYNKKNPNMQLRLPAVLRAVSDKSSSDTETATRLESEQIQSLIRSKKSLDEIIGSLRSDLQPRPFFDKCIEIADEFVKYRPELWYDPIEMFRKRYNSRDLTSIVREEVLNHPHSASRVKDVFFLNLFSRMISPDGLSNMLTWVPLIY